MVSHNIEQIPKQQCQLFLVQTTLLRAVVDYESYKFYKYSCKIFYKYSCKIVRYKHINTYIDM